MRNHLPYDANLARVAELRARAEASRRARPEPRATARQCLASRRAPCPAGAYSRP
jgi:hypothetical protein